MFLGCFILGHPPQEIGEQLNFISQANLQHSSDETGFDVKLNQLYLEIMKTEGTEHCRTLFSYLRKQQNVIYSGLV